MTLFVAIFFAMTVIKNILNNLELIKKCYILIV